MIRNDLGTILMLAGAWLAAAPARLPAQATPGTDSTAALTARGRTLFEGKGLCFSCHGKDGEGALGPGTRLAGRRLVHVKPVLDEIVSLIKAGVDSAHSSNGQVMPPRGGSRLSDSDVVAVAQYVLELQKRKKPD